MKRPFLFLFLFVTCNSFCQDLPVNLKTKLISIQDSIAFRDKSLQEIKGYITKWGYTLVDDAILKSIYNLNNAKQTEIVAINLPVGTVLTRDLGGNKYSTNGTFVYTKSKKVAFTPIITSGSIKFSLIYTVNPKAVIYEFTNFEYSSDMLHYGKFEEEKAPMSNSNTALVFKMGKKEWQQIRREYYAYLQTLSANLKDYLSNLIGTVSSHSAQSKITYASYQAIKNGMSYEEVKKLMGDEGRELNNMIVPANGRNVVQQTVEWRDLDASKSITITFLDGKAISKTQVNL